MPETLLLDRRASSIEQPASAVAATLAIPVSVLRVGTGL
jgi:hypothetical protein